MRRTQLNRILTRSVFSLFIVWIIYVAYEISFISNKTGDEPYNEPPNMEMHIINNYNAQNHPSKRSQTDSRSHNRKEKHLGFIGEKNLQNNIVAEHGFAQGLGRDSVVVKDSLNGDSPKVKEIRYKSQFDKLAEMGGKLVEKKSKESYAKVQLPKFNARIDTSGPGEMGRPVQIDATKLKADEKAAHKVGWDSNGFNQYISDLISIHRSLPDGRSSECKKRYAAQNSSHAKISVIIIFHNEAWTVLLRSVHSILSRTAEHNLVEIILVDDFSTKDHLKEPLNKYFNEYSKVKIVRATKRQGLTRARLLGYFVSTAPIVVFLDSHIECFPGWAEPLIARISEDPTRVVYPSIEVISDNTLHTASNSDINQHGVFRIKDLTFQWKAVPQSELSRRTDPADPIRSPTMPGGLFAISREFFEYLGTYDPGLDYWGGENIELSFKAWMCGGSVELVTCSHIGHIFRSNNPIHWTHDIGSKNSIRVAEVWMDEYKNYHYERILYRLKDYGDVSERKALRQRLKCHNFEWYIKNVFPDVDFPFNIKYAGEVRCVLSPRCLDSMGGFESSKSEPRLYPCHGMGYNQFWYLSDEGQIFQDQEHVCVEGTKVVLKMDCGISGPLWEYRQEDQTLLYIPLYRCLTAAFTTDDITVSTCSDNKYQKWTVEPRRTNVTFPH